MRKPFLILCAVGCTSATEIPRTLPAVLTFTYGNVVGDSSVTPKGDSIIATATLSSACATGAGVSASNVAGEVMIVVTDSRPAVQDCMLDTRYRTLRVAVGAAPAGTYPVQLDYRVVIGGRSSRTMLVRESVSMP